MPSDKIAILLVLYNDVENIPRLTQSLKKQTVKNYAIYALDNNLNDENASILKDYCPEAIVIENCTNTGFAKGNNKLAERAIKDGCTFLFILNADMELAPDCLGSFLDIMRNEEAVGVVGSLLLIPKNAMQDDIIQLFGGMVNFKTQQKELLFANHLLNRQILPNFLEVDFVNGGSTFIRSHVVEKVGLFEEKYFMYNDEIDLAFRVRNLGYKTVVTSSTCIWHYHDWDAKNRQGYYTMYYYMMRNRYLYYFKLRLITYLLWDLAKQIIFIPVKISWARRTADIKLLKYYYLGILHGLLKKTGKANIEFK